MDDPNQIVVTEQTWATLVSTFLRQITLIVTGLAALAALFGKGDIIGIINYLTSGTLISAITVLVTTLVTAYGLLKGYWTKLKLIKLARIVPDPIAVLVKGIFDKTPSTTTTK